MGLWQDIKDTYNYHKEERAQQKYFQEQMKTLHGIEHAAGVNPIQARLNALDYRDKIAQEAPQQRPAVPERSSWLGRMAATLRFGSSQSGAGRGAEFDDARATFSADDNHTQGRYQERQIANNDAQIHNRGVVNQFEAMQTNHRIKTEAYQDFSAIYGKVENATVNRLGPSLMEVAESPLRQRETDASNKQTFDMLQEYDEFLDATKGDTPVSKPGRFQELSVHMANKLRPVIAEGNQFDLSQYQADPKGYAWATPEALATIKNQYHSFMVLSDWAKKPENGPAATLAFGGADAMQTYLAKGQRIAQAYTGLRANAMGDLVNPTREDARTFIHSETDKIAFNAGGATAMQERLADATQKWRPFAEKPTDSAREHFRDTAKTIDPNRPERLNPPQTAEPQKLNMNQLAERANMATAPATQRPAATQQTPQPQKTSAGPRK